MPRPLRGGSGFPQPACSAASSRTALAWRLVEQGSAVFERVLLRNHGEFVDETFDHEDVVRGAHTAPECGRNPRRLLADILDTEVGQCIGRRGGAVHGIHIQSPYHSDEVVEAGCAHHLYSLGKELSLVT